MALLKREEWQGFVRDVDWSYRYVDDEAVYPEWHSGTGKVPRAAWRSWEESYKVSYPEYVATQREKEAAVYAVKAALQRSSAFDSLSEGWKSATKMHFGGVALVEYAAVLAELKMARFGLNGSWRNMATFGQLDELRHAAVTTFFGHEFVGKDAQYDWTQKAFHTNDWVTISLRNLFDAMMISSNVVDIAIELPLTFETGFTNLQFVALAADALASGDVNFANMISSIQTDEARHSQQGGPTLEILVEHDPVRAQWVVDKAFWGSALAPRAAHGPVVLAADDLVAADGRGQPGRTRVAGGEVPQLGAGVRRQVGRDHRQRQLQQHGGDLAGDAALAVQHLPPAGLQRHLRHRLRADPGAGHHREHHGRGGGRGRLPRGGQAGPGAALRQGGHLPRRTAAGRHDRRRRGHQAARSRHGRVRHR
jgi:methane/phenol/toluene hydroxylase